MEMNINGDRNRYGKGSAWCLDFGLVITIRQCETVFAFQRHNMHIYVCVC